ncbi:hypothetical protein HIM_05873 [Hirsutella minnesotensis 3608]|uniref:Uncharacterized protein n=1 Tax=Hirsutella minnesotensis 3608 TaxID=1043627 RepID=A0A0F7ZJX1_9HYPO|nr:hypothetical protein HIM_05873 [Hirsutella minnesotensis 3608]
MDGYISLSDTESDDATISEISQDETVAEPVFPCSSPVRDGVGKGGDINVREFHQTLQSPTMLDKEDMERLELYQAYPHATFSTLCKQHFLALAGPWHRRRRGDSLLTQLDTSSLSPTSAIRETHLNAPRKPSLQEAIGTEGWRRRDADEATRELGVAISQAEEQLQDERIETIFKTGHAPPCGNCPRGQLLMCMPCVAAKQRGFHNVLTVIRHRKMAGQHCIVRPQEQEMRQEHLLETCGPFEPGCGHSEASVIENVACPEEDGLLIRCDTCGFSRPVDLLHVRRKPAHQARSFPRVPHAAYVSVGGLHIVVDICEGHTYIKFQYVAALSAYKMRAESREAIIC